MSGDGKRGEQLARLRSDLVAAEGISTSELAARILEIGFRCLRCGECCTGEDSSVLAFPFEIRRILAATSLEWLQAVEPPTEGEWDRDGLFHTLEWRLKKDGCSCRFYDGERCRIYETRPLLCATYPFFLDRGRLRCSQCPGLGSRMDAREAEDMAKRLVLRYITEIKEALSLIEKYEDFERGDPGKSGRGCIVHDSEGKHRIRIVMPASITELRS